MNKIFPWQQDQWQYLLERKANNALPHALLLSGSAGMGKLTFAQMFAEFLLCKNPNQEACGNCSSCHLISAGTHSDLFLIQPDGKNIKVDQIRQLIDKLSNTSQRGGYQVVIIEPAEMLNTAAANSLLKTLEEPTENIIIILISHQPAMLPATIRSRCQQLIFRSDKSKVLSWLKTKIDSKQNAELLLNLSEQSPLLALALTQNETFENYNSLLSDLSALMDNQINPSKLASRYASQCEQILDRISILLADIVRIKNNVEINFIINSHALDKLKKLSEKISIMRLFKLLDEITETRALLSKSINLNPQLLLENLFIKCAA